jgi:hypothetical protein
MLFEKDWMMRQITVLAHSVALLIFHRDDVQYTVEDVARLSATDLMHNDLMEMLADGRVNEAEDYLFDHFQPGDREYLRLALDFYQRLNLLTDDELETRNFSRDEIYDGLRDIMAQSGMEFYGL